ncbi:MAG: glycerophosphodiester phosphodiesterase [Betaproteobacteria bacterium]
MKRARVIAHRGSSAIYPDNEWAAFDAAVAEGADAIECDVQATRDGMLVVRHDLKLGQQLVADLNFTEVAARAPGVVVLADLLAWAASKDIDLLVEVKEPEATAAVATMIGAGAWRHRIVVGSFHGPALAAVKANMPWVQTSLMIGSVVAVESLIHLATAYRCDGVHLCWESRAARPHRLLDPAAIDQLRRAGLAITLWHEEREDELRALVALEPDAICTNTPAVLRRIVDAPPATVESNRSQEDLESNCAISGANAP